MSRCYQAKEGVPILPMSLLQKRLARLGLFVQQEAAFVRAMEAR